MMVKRILHWNDKKMDELLNSNDRGFVASVKAIKIGVLEGFIDGAAIIGAAVVVKDVVCTIKKILK